MLWLSQFTRTLDFFSFFLTWGTAGWHYNGWWCYYWTAVIILVVTCILPHIYCTWNITMLNAVKVLPFLLRLCSCYLPLPPFLLCPPLSPLHIFPFHPFLSPSSFSLPLVPLCNSTTPPTLSICWTSSFPFISFSLYLPNLSLFLPFISLSLFPHLTLMYIPSLLSLSLYNSISMTFPPHFLLLFLNLLFIYFSFHF